MEFTKAVRKRAKLRLALTGPSNSGKTYGALMIAKGIGGKIAVIDTEHGSASLYSHLVEFDALELSAPYSPERYIEAIRAAEKSGYDVIVIDSTTHEWSGSGGCLEINEKTAQAKFRGNTWSAWNDTTPRHRAFIDSMLQTDCHVIATARSKTETAQIDDGSRKKVVKLGMKTEQRDGFEYEFTVVLDIIHDGHYATVSKDRTGLFGGDPQAISVATGTQLREWLMSGVEATPSPNPGIVVDLMPPEVLADWLAAIGSASTTDDVKQIGREGCESAKAARDRDAYAAIGAAGRARLRELDEAAQ